MNPVTPKRFRCPGCGGETSFDPSTATLSCGHCGRSEQIPQTADEVARFRFDEASLFEAAKKMPPLPQSVACSGCGSTFLFAPPYRAGACPCCGVYLQSEPAAAEAQLPPMELLPFSIDEPGARRILKRWADSRSLFSLKLRRALACHSPRGVYLPYWAFSAFSTTIYHGKRGEPAISPQIETEITRSGQLKTRFRDDGGLQWYDMNGAVCTYHEDIIVPAVQNLPGALLSSGSTCPLDGAVPYSGAYAAGFLVAQPSVDPASGFQQARQRIAPEIRAEICREIGGRSQQIVSSNTSYAALHYRQILLPFWLVTTAAEGEVRHFLVRGTDGQIAHDVPFEARIFLYCAAAAGAVLFILVKLMFPG